MSVDSNDCGSPVLDAINSGLIVLDSSRRILIWNVWMETASGQTRDRTVGKLLVEVFPQANLGRLTSAIDAAFVSSVSTILTHSLNPSLLPLHTKSNRDLLHNMTVSPVGSRSDPACLIFISDVTMAVSRERYLRDQQNARYNAVVAGAADVVLTIDEKGVIQSANPAAAFQFGLAQTDLVGKDAAGLFESKEDWSATWRPALESIRYSHPRELVVRRKDNTVSYLEGSASQWTSGSHVFVTVILRDTSERRASEEALRASEEEARSAAAALKYLNQTLEERVQDRTSQLMKTEEALRHSQKMEAIGNLTGGIAHDFNNLLQVISGNLALLKRDVLGNQAAERRVQKAMDAVSRSAKLSSQLLAFARRQALDPKVINLGRFIRDMEDILRKAVGEGVAVETIIAAGLWNTLLDPGNVENALLNLAINARDAMDGQGRLTIEAGNAFLDSDYALAHDQVIRGQYVLIAVSDTGSGMAPEVVEQAFEPFFTTKPEGKGTGLGLSMVYGFVKQSGGHIKIYSEVGQGTTIKIYLPRSTQAEDRLVDIDTIPVSGGSEVVLVAEDDESVRETVVALLSDLGYRVLKAKDALSALNIVESGMPIDLLLTDVIMPGPMRSTELVRKARERMPNLAVLFTSGYTENAIVHTGRIDDNVELLSKPYSRETLARKLRHVLALASNKELPVPIDDEHHLPVVTTTSPKALRILVCEDDESIREPTVEMLSMSGYLATSAPDARTALSILVSEPVDVLLTDVGLPDMSGLTLAEYALSRHPSLKVVFTTGEGIANLPTGKGVRTLVKPFSFDALLALIASLERAGADR